MPSLRIIYDVAGRASHNRALALQKYAPADFHVSLASLRQADEVPAALGDDPVDLIFLLPHSYTTAVRSALRQHRWRTKLVAGWSVGVPGAIAAFFDQYRDADAWVINNQAAWDLIGRPPRTFMIANGVDLDIFNVQRPPEVRPPKVLWVGSEHHRRVEGYDDLILPLRARLRALGIDCELLLLDDAHGTKERTPQEMAEWYNRGTVLVCASDSEDAPYPALEAAACGCTVVSTRVGNLPELIRHDVNGYLVDRNVEALIAGVTAARESYVRLSRQMQSDIQSWHCAARSTELFALFRNLLEDRPRRVPPRDLSQQVTVFVTTVGAPTFDICMERLRQQDCTYRLQIIDRAAPMNAAFQRMLDECETPYYVQVDEDMLLYPHAVRTLYERISAAAPNVALFVADLYDVHLRRCILGVKIFRHDIVRRYPFTTIDAFETAQLAALAADGYVYVRCTCGIAPVAGQTMGLHGVRWTLPSIYERYMTLARRRLIHPAELAWFAEYPARFLQRYLDEPSPENFFALQGVIAGRLAARHGEAAAKDYRTYAALPGFEPLRRVLDELANPTVRMTPERREGADAPSERRPATPQEPGHALSDPATRDSSDGGSI